MITLLVSNTIYKVGSLVIYINILKLIKKDMRVLYITFKEKINEKSHPNFINQISSPKI